jgi:hypothetical protein
MEEILELRLGVKLTVNTDYCRYFKIIYSSVSVVTGRRAGRPGFDFLKGHGSFLFDTASRPDLGSTQPPSQLVRGALSRRVKREGREAEHSPPCSAEVESA